MATEFEHTPRALLVHGPHWLSGWPSYMHHMHTTVHTHTHTQTRGKFAYLSKPNAYEMQKMRKDIWPRAHIRETYSERLFFLFCFACVFFVLRTDDTQLESLEYPRDAT